MVSKEEYSTPSFLHALFTFLSVVAVISFGLFFLEVSLHSLVVISLLIVSCSAWTLYRGSFSPILSAMNEGITKALSAIYIFLLIGILIASLIQAGTVSAMVYYGLQFISPRVFLPAGLLLCSIMSLATGSSWSTVGTIGIVLMGIGAAMNVPASMTAGVIVSGALFGDKMSPMSDTTNLAAMSAQTELYGHIRSMSYTTLPTYIICLLIFSFVGYHRADSFPEHIVLDLMHQLDQSFSINVLCLLPLAIMLWLSIKKVAAIPAMMAASIAGILIAMLMQGQGISTVLNAIFEGGQYDLGNEMLNELLGRGGLQSMMWTLSLAILVLALGGILHSFSFLTVLIKGLLHKVERTGTLVASTISACIIGNLSMGEAYMSIILGGQLFGEKYDEKGIDRSVLSRSLEEGATLTYPLIPWTTGGAFITGTLGISALEYGPWALLNWMNPLISIAMAYMGIAIFTKPTVST